MKYYRIRRKQTFCVLNGIADSENSRVNVQIGRRFGEATVQ
jgi:hypothetical protein